MKKMNNRGFAISSLLYGLLLVAFLIVSILMSTMAANRKNTTNLIEKIEDELNRFNMSSTIFEFKNEPQEYIVPEGKAGWYRIELWGGKAFGTLKEEGNGRGDYTSGTIYLEPGQKLYFYTGGAGKSDGSRAYNQDNTSDVRNGGATEVRLQSGSCEDAESKDTMIMKALGGVYNDYPNKHSLIAGYEGNKDPITYKDPITNVEKTYSFMFPKIYDTVTSDAGKAKIGLVSINPKTSPPIVTDKIDEKKSVNYYISLVYKHGALLTANNESPSRMVFYDGSKKQKWTIKNVASPSEPPVYTITDAENSFTLQPSKTDHEGDFEEGIAVASLDKYSGQIWQKWQFEEITAEGKYQGSYKIRTAKKTDYCLTLTDFKLNFPFTLEKCSATPNELQTFRLYNAEF